ncbi:MAG: hypothetical protein RLY65_399, partial [Pseudomonadota bacterium]
MARASRARSRRCRDPPRCGTAGSPRGTGGSLDVAHRAAHLGDDDVHVVGGEAADAALDLVGDVRDHLDGAPEVVAAALGGEDRLVDRARRGVGRPGERLVDEALVVAEIEVRLAAVVGDEHLAVLERVHGPRVDVDVRVQLLHRDPQAAHLQQTSEGGGRETLAEGAGHAARHEHVLRHSGSRLASGYDGTSAYPSSRSPAAGPRGVDEFAGVAHGRVLGHAPREHARHLVDPLVAGEDARLGEGRALGHALGHADLRRRCRRHLREVRDHQNLMRPPETGQCLGHRGGGPASDTCVHFVEHQDRRPRRQHEAKRQHHPREFATGGDLGQRSGRQARIGHELEDHVVARIVALH